jgi:hypothetical protein
VADRLNTFFIEITDYLLNQNSRKNKAQLPKNQNSRKNKAQLPKQRTNPSTFHYPVTEYKVKHLIGSLKGNYWQVKITYKKPLVHMLNA